MTAGDFRLTAIFKESGDGTDPRRRNRAVEGGISLERLAEAKGVALKKHGENLIGLCPFHTATPGGTAPHGVVAAPARRSRSARRHA